MLAKTYQGKSLRYISVEPDGYDADRSYSMIILLHGFGSNMSDLAGLAEVIDSRSYVYICPNAPLEMRFGPRDVGYAWADRYDRSTSEQWQAAGSQLNTLIDEVMAQYKVQPGRVLLGGFSQGGMMTYMCGLTRPELFSGIFALSARVPDPEGLRGRLPENRSQKVFVSHGVADSMIPIDEGRFSKDFLEAEGYEVAYHEYRMGHQINSDVVADLRAWLGELRVTNQELRQV